MKTQRVRRLPEDAKALLISAAEAVLEETHFNALTVEMVTRRAGMTRSAFYHYFSSLEELAIDLLEQFEDDIQASVNPWLEHGAEDIADYRGATVTYLSAMYEVFHTHRNGVGAVAQAASGGGRVFAEWQSRVVDYYIDRTAAFITRQIELGRSHVENPGRVAKALILMNNAVGIDNLTRPDPDDPIEIAEVIANR